MPKPHQNVPQPVPLAVWPCADTTSNDLAVLAAPPRDRVTAEIARRVVDTYSHHDAHVAVPLGVPVAAAAVAARGRRVVALAPTRRLAQATVDAARALSPAAVRDLVIRPGQPNQLGRVLGHDTGTVDLVLLAGLPRAKVRHPALLPVAARALRPGGVVAVVVQPSTRGPDLSAQLVAAATACGLRYLQHVVALLRPAGDLATIPPQRSDGRQVVAHADVLIFARPDERTETR